MANPIIDAVTITPSTIVQGGTADILITAHDPDAMTVALSIVVTDSGGNQTTGTGTIPVTDPLTYAVTTNHGTVTQDATNPRLFHFVDA